MASLPLRFSDGNLVRNKKELKEAFNKYASDIIKCISDGRLAEFLDGKEETWKMLVEEGLNTGRRELEIYKQLAEKMGVTVDINNVSDRSIVKHEGSLKDVLQSGETKAEFTTGIWEVSDSATITGGKDITGMSDGTVLKIGTIIINVPKETEITINNLFFKSYGEESLINVKSGKVCFSGVHFERVRIEASGDSIVEIGNHCTFETLNKAALTKNDDSRIVYDTEDTKFEKCKKTFSSTKHEEVISKKEASRYIQDANRGDPEAQYKLGKYYYDKEDYDKAIEYWQKAADQQYLDAQCYLGECYHDGKGVKKNYTKALEYLRKAVDQGHINAHSILGSYYLKGDGVKRNYTKALEYLQKAAEHDDKDAKYYLGVCYYNGNGVKMDKNKASVLFHESAEKGNMDAQYDLGVYYIKGSKDLNIHKDRDKALKWYRKAAQQGHKEAEKRLKNV